MIKKLIKLIAAVGFMLAIMTSTAFAAGWTVGQDGTGRWWYDLGNGQYYSAADEVPEWQWLDGNQDGTAECYAFDRNGWMYAGTATPDGYTVNADGAWVVGQNVQTLTVAAGYAGTGASLTARTDEGQGKRILVAYFSHSGTTAESAREIQAVSGGDLFEIQTTANYPDSYQRTVDTARRELDQNARPALASRVEHMEDYDVILLGYPIWWHTAPMSIQTFLDSYDFTGKIILPFCTSGGSSIEESMPDIRSNAGGAVIGSGLTANSVDTAEIINWLTANGVK